MALLRTLKIVNFKYLLVLVMLSLLAGCDGGTGEPEVTDTRLLGVSWAVPDGREDGTGLLSNEIAGYRIYYGADSGEYETPVYIEGGSTEQGEVIVPVGKYYVVVTTVDTDGRESQYSPETSL